MSTIPAAEPVEGAIDGVSLYRAIWRWHFFAGLLVIPFMLNLAITGSLYLFKDEINSTFFGYRYIVQPAGDAGCDLSRMSIQPLVQYTAKRPSNGVASIALSSAWPPDLKLTSAASVSPFVR